MLDVCLGAVIAETALSEAVAVPVIFRRATAPLRCFDLSSAANWTPSEYQNTVESAYGLLPRPPQTPSARFKRLYRK
jgi:hypothetical protein